MIELVYKLCYLKKGKWLNSNTGGSIPSQFYPSKEENKLNSIVANIGGAKQSST